jgi:TonB-linked SusC/RagA family outer membrane protein
MNKLLLSFIAWLLLCTSVFAQTRSITGKVTSKDSEPLVGVSIGVKGTSQGGTTDVNGAFKFTIPSTGAVVLTARYIGYKSQEVTVGSQSQLTITMQEDDATMLNEVKVVNIGYGTVSREAITGSVSSVGANDLKQFPVSTAAEALAGKLAGVTVTTTEGRPGADILVRVRGGNSLTRDNSPLYVVDGIIVDNALSLISPQEIQSIDVLKDVASTAIYGARGSNGVVLITTKTGREGKTRISINSYGGFRKISNELPVLDPYEFVKFQYEITNLNTTQETKDAFTKSYGTYQDIDIYKNMPFTDWQNEVFGRNAYSHTENINLLGGSKTSDYSLTLNNTNEQGIQLQSGFRRVFAAFRFNNVVSDKFKWGFNVRYSRQRTDGVGTSATGSQGNNRLRNSVRFRPFVAPGLETQVDVFDVDYANLTNLTSPTLLVNNELQYAYRNDVITSVNGSYNILKNLSFNVIAGLNNTDTRSNAFSGSVTAIARQNANLPVAVINTGNGLTITNSNTLNYNTTINKDHVINLLVGQEINQTNNKYFNATTKYLLAGTTAEQAFASIQTAVPPSGLIQDAPTTGQGGYRLFSLFGRAQYAYKSKYLATFSYRADGSSLFAMGRQYGYYPSGQVAWRITEEEFMKGSGLQWINNLKIRLSYGSGGNNRIGENQFRTFLVSSSNNYGYAVGESITPGLAPTLLANPNVKWETTVSRNLGFDFAVLNNRISGSIDLYKNNTHDLLLDANIPPTSGYRTQTQNIGGTSNKGLEIQLNGVVANTKNFSYSAGFNISFNRNKIESLGLDQYGNPIQSYLVQSGWVNSLNDFRVGVGEPIGQFYGYVSDGRYEVDDFTATQNATTGAYTYTLKAGIPNTSAAVLGNRQPQPGDQKLKKLSGGTDMTIGEADRTILGNALPKFTGGFTHQLTYKNFDMNLFMNFSVGSKVYNANKMEFTTQYQYRDNNMLTVVKDRWKNFDDNGVRVTDPNALKALNANTTFWTPSTGNYTLTSYAIESGSYLRITNLTLGYTLPQSLLKRTGVFSRFRVYATVNNLATITGYTGYDPEANTRRGTPLTPGVDYAAYPRSRYILAGLEIGL